MAIDGLPLLRLLQLVSPALPVGAYAYSQGLEQAVASGWVHDEASAGDWIVGLLAHPLSEQDAPVLARLHRAWTESDTAATGYWNAWLHACRESAELRREDNHLGKALARLLTDLAIEEAKPWLAAPRVCFATPFALAATRWAIPLDETVSGYLWAWLENQITAAVRLIPLGQTAGQRLLARAMPSLRAAVGKSLVLTDGELGCSAPGLGLASIRHETQYSRLFRS